MINLIDLDGDTTVDELAALIEAGEAFAGTAPVPGGDDERDVLTGKQMRLYARALTSPVLSEDGTKVLHPAVPGETTLNEAVTKIREAYRLTDKQYLFGVINEFRARERRAKTNPNAPMSPRSERSQDTWLARLGPRNVAIGGDNAHLDVAVEAAKAEMPDEVAALRRRVAAAEKQGQWNSIRRVLAGYFGEWATTYDTDGSDVEGESEDGEVRPTNTLHASNTNVGDSTDPDDEPF